MVFPTSLLAAGTTLLLSTSTLAHFVQAPGHAQVAPRALAPRQATTAATTTARGRTTAAAATATRGVAGAALPVSPMASLALIGTATTEGGIVPLPTTFAAGSTPPLAGAPMLPVLYTIDPTTYPPLDRQPPVDSPEVLQWISEINLAGAPRIPVNGLNGCQNTTFNAAAVANASSDGNCWWTCGGCSRATDITYCPTKDTWGVSFDDGPSPYTPRLLALLTAQNIKSTFFIVGSRAISYPAMVQAEYMMGHQLSVHTWAHPALTSMTNEQIVAELGWTKKIIKEVTGVTPNTMRPPYGDIDDRVRYISLQMGLTPIIWTSTGGNTFDTRDWQIGGGVVNATDVYTNFESYLTTAATSLASGFIVLAHDLYQQSVELAVDYILPNVINAGVLTLEPIITCLGLTMAEAYIETASNTTSILEATTPLVGASGIGFVDGVESTSSVKDTATDTGTSRIPGSTAGSSTTAPSGADKGKSVGAGLGSMLLGAGLWAMMV